MSEINPKINNQEVLAILEAIGHYSNGASLKDIQQILRLEIARRTLQRRLSELVQQRIIVKQGEKRTVIYRLSSIYGGEISGKKRLMMTPQAQEIKHYVEQSLQNRKPVGYNAEFINSYQPNHSSYLSEVDLRHLDKISVIPDGKLIIGTYGKELLNRLLIDLSWNSSRLEGNTYSLLETENLILKGEQAKGKSWFETQMILNHKRAIEFITDSSDEIGFNNYTILNLHAMLSDGLLPNPEASGRLRKIPVGISGTAYHPLEIPQLLEAYFQQILNKATAIKNPFEQAFFVLIHLAYLQPFEDVNKRVSRLSTLIPLIKNNLCPISFIDVSNQDYTDGILGIYELNRVEILRDVFIWAYERSAAKYAAIRQSLGEPDSFRIRYRNEMQELVTEIIGKYLNKTQAIPYIQNYAKKSIPEENQIQFIELIEKELLSLHEGNFARYRVTPTEFEKWINIWKNT